MTTPAGATRVRVAVNASTPVSGVSNVLPLAVEPSRTVAAPSTSVLVVQAPRPTAATTASVLPAT